MAKARTLGEALCRMQKDDGFIPTLWFGSYPTNGDRGWLNCLAADAAALDALSTANP